MMKLMDDKKDEVTASTDEPPTTNQPPQDAWERLRGIAKDIYAEYGGGEAYLRYERESFDRSSESE